MQAKEKDSAARIKKFMTMMDSMTNKELDSSDIKLWQTESRIMRIARGAGVHPNYVGELIGRSSLIASAFPHHMCSPRRAQGMLEDCLMAAGNFCMGLFYNLALPCICCSGRLRGQAYMPV